MARSDRGRPNSKRRCRTRRPILAAVAAAVTALLQLGSDSARVRRRRLRVPLRRRWSASCRSPRVRTTRPSSVRHHPSGDEQGAFPTKSDTLGYTLTPEPNLQSPALSFTPSWGIPPGLFSPSLPGFSLGLGVPTVRPRILVPCIHLALPDLLPMLIPLPPLFLSVFALRVGGRMKPSPRVHTTRASIHSAIDTKTWTLFSKFQPCPSCP